MAVINKIKKGADEYDVQDPNAATKTELQALETTVSGKQNALTETQLAAVNSGIDSTKVGQIATNASDIDTIEGKIPSAATAQNQLADKTYVDTADNGLQSQIDAISASSDVKDIVGTKAELNNYDTSTLGNNDIIKVLQDESEDDATTYYRWSTSTNSFTLIGEEGPYYTKSQANALLDDKVDKVTGKGLSENDFTTTLKDKLDGIEAGAEVNDINSISVNGTTVTPDANKNVALTIPAESVKVLTANDYNWPTTGTKTGVASWLLESGTYVVGENTVVYRPKTSAGDSFKTINAGWPIFVTLKATTLENGSLSVFDSGTNNGPYLTTFLSIGASTGVGQIGFMGMAKDSFVGNNRSYVPMSISLGNQMNTALQNKADKTAFTGTDGTSAGTAGLVPAPATTDAGKFLKADGSWGEAGGSAVTQLTSADLNYPATGTKTTLATWSLAPGNYSFYNDSDSNKTLKMAADSSMQFSVKAGETIDFSVQRVGWSLTSDSVYLVRTYVATNNKIYAAIAYNTNGNVPDGSASTRNSIILTQHNITDTTGTSTTDVMSQNASTLMVYKNNARNQIAIGSSVDTGSTAISSGAVRIGIGARVNVATNNSIGIGNNCTVNGIGDVCIGNSASDSWGNTERIVAIGDNATIGNNTTGSVALGAYSATTSKGEVNIGSSNTSYGYNSSNYRLLSGVYDGQSAHDAATKGQLDSIAIKGAGAPTTSTTGAVGQLYEDTTNGKLYICTAIVPGTDPDPDTYTWEEAGGLAIDTTFWGQTASNGKVNGDLGLLGANSNNWTRTIAATRGSSTPDWTQNNPTITFGYRGTGETVPYLNLDSEGGGTNSAQIEIANDAGEGVTIKNAILRMTNHKITELADGTANTDAATLAQGNKLATSAPTTSTVGVLGQLYTDTTNMHTYQCTAINNGEYTWTQRW